MRSLNNLPNFLEKAFGDLRSRFLTKATMSSFLDALNNCSYSQSITYQELVCLFETLHVTNALHLSP